MGSVSMIPPLIVTLFLLLLLSIAIVDGGVRIPTTLDGPFKPVTVPLDKSFRGNAVDLPDTDPLVQRNVEGFQPEQISLSLSVSHSSVWVSWITGEFQIGENIEPLDPTTVGSIVQYGRFGKPLTRQAAGYSLVYSQLYPFEGLQNYTSGIIHHVRITGLKPDTLYQYKCGDPSLSAMSDVHYFRTMPVSGPKSYPSRIAVVGDLGLTYNTTSTVDHMTSNHPELILLVGDASYANLYLTNGSSSDCYSCSFSDTPIHETYQPRWDYWGRYMQPLISSVPVMVVEGNHEIEQQAENKTFVAYSSRFAFPSEESGSSSTFYYSFNAGGIHFIMLGSYISYNKSGDQYKWLEKDLASVDRGVTPWLVATWHAPWYSTIKYNHFLGLNMSSSIAPASLATSLASSVSTYQQAKTSNPLSWTDDKILETVYITHVHTGERFDVESLFILTSNILKRSTAVADSVVSKTGTPVGLIEDKVPLPGYEPPFRKLKHISSQMMTTLPGEHHAHMTTMSILDQLKTHTWDGKAIFALAAFSLEYGNFWHLVQTPSGDTLGRSLAVMNKVHGVEKNRQAIADYNSLVKNLLYCVECITELEKLSTKGYDSKDVPALPEAMQEIPVAVYWAIITAIICANHLDLLVGDSDDRYELSSFDVKLASIVSKLKAHLTRSRRHIGELEDYWRRKRVLQTPTEIVEVIKVLIFHNEIQDPLVYDGLNRQMVSIEVFRKKNVLVFISGLDSIRDEIRLLNSIYIGLNEDPKELKGYRKEDFKILWIPVVDEWTLLHKAEFDNLKLDMPWYVAEYFYPLAGIRLIREDLNYKNKPILPVLNSQGRIVNYNAMHMIFVWGIDAFPFRPDDDEILTQKWNWFWAEMKKVYPKLQEIIKGDTFIFIYGGTDPKWTNDFSLAVEKIRRHEIIRKADAVIEQYHFGKEDKRIVPRFWIGIESLFANMIQKKHKDPTIDEIKSLLCLKQDQPGWVLLSKGPNVKLLGRGDQMLATAIDFEIWKEKVLEKAGFDVAFKEYYERKRRDFPVACANMQLANYPADILDPIYCPDSSCGRSMEIASVSYKCCHGHTHQKSDAPAESGVVQIEKRS